MVDGIGDERARWEARYKDGRVHSEEPARFLAEALSFVPASELPGRPALDVATGEGRQASLLVAHGLAVFGADIAWNALDLARRAVPGARGWVQTNLTRPPFRPGSFHVITVFTYLERSLFGELERWLDPGGWLVYQTYTTDQIARGWGPRRPEFLLRRNELLRAFPGLDVVLYRECDHEDNGCLASLLARKPL